MKIRLKNKLNECAVFWRIVPTAMLLVLSLIAFQSSGANSNEAKNIEVSVIKRALPIYPKYAVKKGVEGAVLINFSIDTDGNASDIQVVASDQDGLFDASAILGVQMWLYTKPAKKIRNNFVSFEFGLTDKPDVRHFSNVEIIQVRGE